MCKILNLVIFLLLLLFTPSHAWAQRWLSVDARARAMGQTGVASVEGPLALYWNPSRISGYPGKSRTVVQIDGFAGINVEGDLVNTSDQLSDLINEFSISSIQERLNSGTITADDLQHTVQVLDVIARLDDPGSGIVADAGAGMVIQKNNWAFSYRYLGRVGLSSYLDFGTGSLSLTTDGLSVLNDGLDRIVQERIGGGMSLNHPVTESGIGISQQLQTLAADAGILLPLNNSDEFAYQVEQTLGERITDERFQSLLTQVLTITAQASTGGQGIHFLTENNSGVEYRGIQLHEIAVGRSFGRADSGYRVSAGLSGRVLFGETFRRVVGFRQITDGEHLVSGVFDSISSNRRSSVEYTFDAGLNYAVSDSLGFGVSVRNMLPVTFRFDDGGKFHLDRQVRSGLVFRHPRFSWLTLSVDADLTVNGTDALPGYKSRILGGGAELTTTLGRTVIALRAGSFANLLAADPSPVITLGAGLENGPFFIEAEGNITARNLKIESSSLFTKAQDFPEQIGGSITLGFRFGR